MLFRYDWDRFCRSDLSIRLCRRRCWRRHRCRCFDGALLGSSCYAQSTFRLHAHSFPEGKWRVWVYRIVCRCGGARETLRGGVKPNYMSIKLFRIDIAIIKNTKTTHHKEPSERPAPRAGFRFFEIRERPHPCLRCHVFPQSRVLWGRECDSTWPGAQRPLSAQGSDPALASEIRRGCWVSYPTRLTALFAGSRGHASPS